MEFSWAILPRVGQTLHIWRNGNGPPARVELTGRWFLLIRSPQGQWRSLLAGRGVGLVAVASVGGGLFGEGLEGLGVNADFGVEVGLEAGSGRDQVAQDHVLLEADEVVDLAGQGGLGEHLGRLL